MADSSDIIATLTKIVHRRENAAIHAVCNQRPRSPSVPNELTPTLICCGLPKHICNLLTTASPSESTSFFPESAEDQIDLDGVRFLLGRFAATLPHGIVILRRFCSPYSWEECVANSDTRYEHQDQAVKYLRDDPFTFRLPYCGRDSGIDVSLDMKAIDGAEEGPVTVIESKHIAHYAESARDLMQSLFVWRPGKMLDEEDVRTGIPSPVRALAIQREHETSPTEYFDILVYEIWLLHDDEGQKRRVSLLSVNLNCRSGRFTFSNGRTSLNNAIRMSIGLEGHLREAVKEWNRNNE